MKYDPLVKLKDVKKYWITEALKFHAGRKKLAAESLGISCNELNFIMENGGDRAEVEKSVQRGEEEIVSLSERISWMTKLSEQGRHALSQMGLTKSEFKICEKMVVHSSHQDVADSLFLTEKTVKFHLTKIYKKLGVDRLHGLMVFLIPFCKDPVSLPQKPVDLGYDENDYHVEAEAVASPEAKQNNDIPFLPSGMVKINKKASITQ